METTTSERGQALIIIVFVIIGLLVAVGLAIDGGTTFLTRRRMQNAADAASLAGTRQLAMSMCDQPPRPATHDLAIYSQVVEYAARNGVDDPSDVEAHYLRFVGNDAVEFDPPVLVGNSLTGGSGVPDDASGVAATTEAAHPTYFLGLVGRSTAGATASAKAVTGPPLLISGLRPFGIPYAIFTSLELNDCITITFGNNCDDDDCLIEYPHGEPQAHRGWMNLNFVWNQGENASWPRAVKQNPEGDLDDWMIDGWQGVLYADCLWDEGCRWGDFIHSEPGVEESVLNVAPIPETFIIPIFDEFPNCDGTDPDLTDPWASPPGAAADACTGMAGATYYHIVGFVGVETQSMSVPDHSLTMCIREPIITGKGQPSPGGEGYGTGACQTYSVKVVTLWD